MDYLENDISTSNVLNACRIDVMCVVKLSLESYLTKMAMDVSDCQSSKRSCIGCTVVPFRMGTNRMVWIELKSQGMDWVGHPNGFPYHNLHLISGC